MPFLAKWVGSHLRRRHNWTTES